VKREADEALVETSPPMSTRFSPGLRPLEAMPPDEGEPGHFFVDALEELAHGRAERLAETDDGAGVGVEADQLGECLIVGEDFSPVIAAMWNDLAVGAGQIARKNGEAGSALDFLVGPMTPSADAPTSSG